MLKKTLMCSLLAVVLGLLVTLTPLIIFAEVETALRYAMVPDYVLEGPWKPEGAYGLGAPAYSISDFGVLLACFALASMVYVFFKHSVLVSSS